MSQPHNHFFLFKRAEAGFSLLEAMTIIGIIAFLYFLSTPIIKQYLTNLEINNSTKFLISNLRLAQEYTVSQQIKHSIKINILGTAYYLIKKGASDIILQTYNLDESTFFSATSGLINEEVIFNPTGAVDFSGTIDITHGQSQSVNRLNIKPSGYVSWSAIND